VAALTGPRALVFLGYQDLAPYMSLISSVRQKQCLFAALIIPPGSGINGVCRIRPVAEGRTKNFLLICEFWGLLTLCPCDPFCSPHKVTHGLYPVSGSGVSVYSVLEAIAGEEVPPAAQAFLLITDADVFTGILAAVHAKAFAAFSGGQGTAMLFPFQPPPGAFPPGYGWAPPPGYGMPPPLAPGQAAPGQVPMPTPVLTPSAEAHENPLGDFVASEQHHSRPRDPRRRMTACDPAPSITTEVEVLTRVKVGAW
jgi:hypothetical protein